jgi:hypothetical protein
MGQPCCETVSLINVQGFCSDPRGGDVTFDTGAMYSTYMLGRLGEPILRQF